MARNLLTDNQASLEENSADVAQYGYGGTYARSQEQARHGTWSWKVVADSYDDGIGLSSAFYPAALPGVTYTVSGYFYAAPGVSCKVRIYAYDAAKSHLAPSVEGTEVAGDGTWQRIVATRTMPAGTAYIGLSLSTQQAGIAYFDCLQIEQADAASIWRLPSVWAERVRTRKRSLMRNVVKFTSRPVTVGISAAQIIRGHREKAFLNVFNDSQGTVYLGNDSSVSSTTGLPVEAGEVIDLSGFACDLFAIGSSSDLAAQISEGFAADSPNPWIDSTDVASGVPAATVVITGANFGASQGSGKVYINDTEATVSAWADAEITCAVPDAVGSDFLKVDIGGFTSNSIAFAIT